MEKVAKNSIRKKVARRVVMGLLVTVIALSTVNIIYMCRRVIQEQNKELSLAAELCASQIDDWTDKMISITTDTADTLGALKMVDETNTKRVLTRLIKSHDDLFLLYVATEDGDMYMANNVAFPSTMDVRERPWYTGAKEARKTVVIDPYPSATNPDLMHVTVATPIYINDEFVGVVGADAEISKVNEFIGSINFENGAYGFLIDSEGNIVAHPNPEYSPTVDTLTSIYDVMPEIGNLIESGSDEKITDRDYNGINMIYSVKKLESSDWVVGVAYPEKNILKIMFRGIRISLFMAIICIFFAAADMTISIKKILLPIEKINPTMDRIMEGDFTTRLDISTEEDELGALQRKMSVMIKQLSDMIHKQEYVLGEMEKGNLMVDNIEEFPGELNEIANSVNSIKAAFNDIISDIQFSAINLQSYAMGINETSDLEEMRAVFEELSAEANALMEKTSHFTTT